eukprot:5060660-Prorocentrum_lima.AAC.1
MRRVSLEGEPSAASVRPNQGSGTPVAQQQQAETQFFSSPIHKEGLLIVLFQVGTNNEINYHVYNRETRWDGS